jgi:hypothetical protein
VTVSPGVYTFLPWLRLGLANKISGSAGQRATIGVQLRISGDGVDGVARNETVSRAVQLYGPGDIVGIDARAIVKSDPRPWTANFESNYLPHVDFYDEEFTWRYTPAAASGDRLLPWITLAVLKEDEFSDVREPRRPLPSISVPAAGKLLPPPSELWAWAHVHVNRPLAAPIVSSDGAAAAAALEATLNENPDLAYSRLLSPRRLAPNQAYHAFVIPTFESGRLAGLGENPAGAATPTTAGWTADAPETVEFPVYHRWSFRTGEIGDFEYLVRLLQPRPPDVRVGRRPMDVQDAGSNVGGIDDPDIHGVLHLGGALRVPDEALDDAARAEIEREERWDDPYPDPFQERLAALLDLADDYVRADSAEPTDPDPLVLPPIYGRWHAAVQRILTERDGTPSPQRQNWVHELNLDPRFRVAAGFGTAVIQQYQEDYMAAAWDQVGRILEANRTIRLAQAAREVSNVWHARSLVPLAEARPARALTLTAPVHRRVLTDRVTVSHTLDESRLPAAAVSAPMRRIVRPRGRLVRALPFDSPAAVDAVVTKLAAGEVSAAPARVTPPDLPTVDEVARRLAPPGVPPWLAEALRRWPWLRFAPLALAAILLLLLLLGPGIALGAVLVAAAAALVGFYRVLSRWTAVVAGAAVLDPERRTPESVAELPNSPDFRITDPGTTPPPFRRGADGPEAVRFKGSLRDAYTLLSASASAGATPARAALPVRAAAGSLVDAVDPKVTVPLRVARIVRIPRRLAVPLVDDLAEVMAYPVIDLPMYKPLTDISTEMFLPNLNLVENNSITLLETNQRFIESYMVGLNHEFARELLWREFLCDLRGTTFRQFWDVRDYLAEPGIDPEVVREQLRDIPPLHRWSRRSVLGDHDNRELSGTKEEELVLVIRGELLKRYPTAVVYAHKAEWERTDGEIDRTRPRQLADLGADEEHPPRDKVLTPLYTAPVPPDIYFFGFDLTVEQALGGSGEQDTDDPGWFFVIKERPGEPRFGLDIDSSASVTSLSRWDELAWNHLLPPPDAGPPQFLRLDRTVTLVAPTPPVEEQEAEQHAEDVNVRWSPSTDSAEIAYVLYQVPVLVAVHAAEMLRPRP